MSEPLTHNIQDYLKTIYSLTSDGEEASTSALAVRLGISPPSVTEMLQKLSSLQPPLVIYQKHRGAHLTTEGKLSALEVLRHHRLLESYLFKSLGYPRDAVHEEACRLEHVISEEFEKRISDLLGNPLRDPHGAPIPSPELVMPTTNDIPLSGLRVGEKAVIRCVGDEDSALLRRMESLGLVPGAILEIFDYSSHDHTLTMKIDSHQAIVLDASISRNIFIEKIYETQRSD